MANAYVTRPIPGSAMEWLRESAHTVAVNPEDRLLTRSDLLDAVRGADGVLTQLGERVDAELMDAAGPQLRVVSNYAAGVNNVDVAAATERHVVVGHTPDVLTEATADLAWVLLLGVARRVGEGDRMVREGGFRGWSPTMLLGGEVVGKTLLLVGAGRIAQAVGRRATAWGMDIRYVARSRREAFEQDTGARWVDLDRALPEADFVSLHVPLTEETHHLLGRDRLSAMKPSAYLINTARGPVVDEAALVNALQSGALAGAGLDVYEREPEVTPELLRCENTLLLPHIGSATTETRAKMSELAVVNLLRVLDGRRPAHAVNDEVVGRLGLS